MTDIDVLIANLEELMRTSGLKSQVKLARAAGISQTNLSNIMRGAVSPKLETLEALADALQTKSWALLAPPDVKQLCFVYARASEEDRQTLLRVSRLLHESY